MVSTSNLRPFVLEKNINIQAGGRKTVKLGDKVGQRSFTPG